MLVGSDKVFEAPPLARAPELLAGLLDLYWKGLTRPLKFFPQTAWAYADAVLKQEAGRSKQEPIAVARAQLGGQLVPGRRPANAKTPTSISASVTSTPWTKSSSKRRAQSSSRC